MSYCRWSSDNWKCDLYCYEDVNGCWTTHVASRTIVGDVPEELDMRSASPEAWLKSHQAAMDFLVGAERRPIGLPHDGETFRDPTLGALMERLLYLRGVGYSFPDYVIEEVGEEIEVEAKK